MRAALASLRRLLVCVSVAINPTLVCRLLVVRRFMPSSVTSALVARNLQLAVAEADELESRCFVCHFARYFRQLATNSNPNSSQSQSKLQSHSNKTRFKTSQVRYIQELCRWTRQTLLALSVTIAIALVFALAVVAVVVVVVVVSDD